MNRFEIIKHASNRWEVRGMICVDSRRWKLDEYSRVFTTKAAAKSDAEKWERLVVDAFNDYCEIGQVRLENAKAYIADRAGRPSNQQLRLF